jgi:hypothetical protein
LSGVVEVLAAAVDAAAGDQSESLPFFDGRRGGAEVACDLSKGEHAGGSEPFAQAGDVVGAAEGCQ